jgi:sporulation-control protein
MGKLLSSIGIGSATVDTILPAETIQPGETVRLRVEMIGGDAEQTIDGMYFRLKSEAEGGEEITVDEYVVDEGLTLESGEERTRYVDVDVPLWTPLTLGETTVWLETGLEIDWAVDPTDSDALEVVPEKFVAALLDAVDALEFTFEGTSVDRVPWVDDAPFAQKLRFRPDGKFRRDVTDLVVTVVPRGDDVRLFVEIDQRDSTAEHTGMDYNEQEISMTIDTADAGLVRRRLEAALQRFS